MYFNCFLLCQRTCLHKICLGSTRVMMHPKDNVLLVLLVKSERNVEVILSRTFLLFCVIVFVICL